MKTPNKVNILIACEESQRICIAFRDLGFRAFSCDLQECSGGYPEWHIQGDVLRLINGKCAFYTCDKKPHLCVKWDLIIAHPPCTHLASSGARWYKDKQHQQELAIEFFMEFVNAECDHIAIENPVGIMSTRYRKPDQYIQPYQFGDPARKRTGLWLKNLPLLKPTQIVEPNLISYKCKNGRTVTFSDDYCHTSGERAKSRSKTYPGIAKAIATQWGEYLLKESNQ